MTEDIVERLHIEANASEELNPEDSDHPVMREAAAEITALRTEVKRLNDWADGFSDAQQKERSTGEEYQRELREEIAQLRVATNSTKLLSAIRAALDLNEYFPFSHLDAKAAEMKRQAKAAEAECDKAEADCAAMRLKLSDLSFCLFCDLDFAGGEQHLDDCPLAQMTAGKELLERMERLEKALGKARALNHDDKGRKNCTLCKIIDTALNDKGSG